MQRSPEPATQYRLLFRYITEVTTLWSHSACNVTSMRQDKDTTPTGYYAQRAVYMTLHAMCMRIICRMECAHWNHTQTKGSVMLHARAAWAIFSSSSERIVTLKTVWINCPDPIFLNGHLPKMCGKLENIRCPTVVLYPGLCDLRDHFWECMGLRIAHHTHGRLFSPQASGELPVNRILHVRRTDSKLE